LDSLARQAHLERVVTMDPLKKRSIKDRSQLKESPIGTTGNIVLLATMIGLAWTQATRGQTTEMPTIERGNSHAVRNQTDDLALAGEQGGPSNPPAIQRSDPQWAYGGFLDAAYLLDFNHPTNDLFRSRGTTYKVDEPILNMEATYLRKSTSD